MTANTVNGGGNKGRAGAQTLVMLATPLNVAILHAVARGARRQVDLRRETGFPSQTTMRAQLKRLTATGALAKHRRESFPGTLQYELTTRGNDLLLVGKAMERWLAEGPEEDMKLGSDSARAAIRAFADGWSTAILRALSTGARTLTELDRLISTINYPSLERRLGALRLSAQVEAQPGEGRGTPYAATAWLRKGVAPLVAAIRWEQKHLRADSPPLSPLDIETVFLLPVPLVRLPDDISGRCRLAVELSGNHSRDFAGVDVIVTQGRIASCSTRLGEPPTASVTGPPGRWLNALIESDLSHLELGTDSRLARAVFDSLHNSLFGARTPLTHA